MDAPSFKVVMLGNSGVGKTALVEKITTSDFNESHNPTIGAQYVSLEIRVGSTKIVLELWDTAGQEVFRSLVGFYARDAKGVFLVCDITESSTIKDLEKWVQFIEEQAPDSEVILFANKLDLAENRQVKESELEEFAKQNKFTYIEGSAKTGQSVDEAFSRMAELVFGKSKGNDQDLPIQKPKEKKDKDKKKCC